MTGWGDDAWGTSAWGGTEATFDTGGTGSASATTTTPTETIRAGGYTRPLERAQATTLTADDERIKFGANPATSTATPLTPTLAITSHADTTQADVTQTTPTPVTSATGGALLTLAKHWYHITDETAELDNEVVRVTSRTIDWEVSRDAQLAFKTTHDRTLTVDDEQ